MPKREVNPAEEEPKRRSAWLSVKPATVKAETKPKKSAFKEKSEQKKAQTKGKKEPKGKQTEEANKEEIKDKLPEENGEVKHGEVPISHAAGEKEAKSE